LAIPFKSARMSMTIGSVALVTGALIAGSAVAASAATAASTPSTSTVTATAVKATPAKPVVKKALLKKKYGIYPLPVSERSIKKYHLSKRQIRDIAQAKRFAKTAKVTSIRWRESNGQYKINTGNGYFGAYQFDSGTWASNGGRKFGYNAHQAPKWAQDYIMFKTWQKRGFSPWGG